MLLGLIVAPARALAGPAVREFWPTPPPQVAEFSAVTSGLVIVLWLCGVMPGRSALARAGRARHLADDPYQDRADRHAGRPPRRRPEHVHGQGPGTQAVRHAGLVVSVVAMTLSGVLTTWLARGESTQQLTELTGRTTVWTRWSRSRATGSRLFGFGLSNKSFNGLPIDSNWLASYQDLGCSGSSISAAILVFLLVRLLPAARRAAGPGPVPGHLLHGRSFTETGFSDASTYLLELTLAASLLVPPVGEKSSV